MRTAIVYDRVNKIGGAERVLESLRDIFPSSTLYTSIYNKKKTPWAKKFSIKTSFIQRIPLLNLHHEFIPYLMPFAFESFQFKKFDLVISVTSEASKGIIVPTGIPHVCICLTPTRYLWSGYDEYFKNIILRVFGSPVVSYLRKWDLVAAQRPDAFIAISKNVARRIKKYYKRESTVIYPPSDRLFKRKIKNVKISEKGYFLVVSRLVDYKRVDLAVKACTKMKLPLIVIGEGGEYERLTAIAGETITFKGRVSDEALISYYNNCRAFLFPGEEDFGITMVEAQFAGKPVIAYRAGGAVEILQEGITGAFFREQTVGSLCNALKKFKESRYNEKDCKTNAKRFTEEKFRKELLAFLRKNKYI
jgi:glycosyltransferase involved in cell wall biosynthesis